MVNEHDSTPAAHRHDHGDPDHTHDDHGEHDHGHDDHDDHDHSHGSGLAGVFGRLFHTHGHSEQRLQRAADPALDNATGIRTVWLALGALGITTVMQIVIVTISGSAALYLRGTIHI